MAVSPADEYRHACDTIDEQAVTIALLLEENAELTAIVESVRAVRLQIVAWINDSGTGRRGQIRRRLLCRVVTLLDQVGGL